MCTQLTPTLLHREPNLQRRLPFSPHFPAPMKEPDSWYMLSIQVINHFLIHLSSPALIFTHTSATILQPFSVGHHCVFPINDASTRLAYASPELHPRASRAGEAFDNVKARLEVVH